MNECKWTVEMKFRVLEVSRNSYYLWNKGPIGQQAKQTHQMEVAIKGVCFEAKGRYGSPRLSKELSETGSPVSRKTVAKHVKDMGLKSKVSRKYKATTDSCHKEPVAENILNRDFVSFSSALKCVSDITY